MAASRAAPGAWVVAWQELSLAGSCVDRSLRLLKRISEADFNFLTFCLRVAFTLFLNVCLSYRFGKAVCIKQQSSETDFTVETK